MTEKAWSEMDGWEKAWEVTKVVAGLAVAALGIWAVLSGGGPTVKRIPSRPIRSGGGSVWTVGHGGKKGYGSWSSFRHR